MNVPNRNQLKANTTKGQAANEREIFRLDGDACCVLHAAKSKLAGFRSRIMQHASCIMPQNVTGIARAASFV